MNTKHAGKFMGILLVITILFVSFIVDKPISTVAAATKVDDSSSSVTYSGTWGTGNGTANYNSTEHYSGTTNSYAEFTFTGTSIRWYGVKNQWCGIADVYIDNVKQTSVDAYSASQLDQQLLYSNTGLTNASHKIKIVVTGTKNTSSGGINVSIDAFEYDTVTSTPVKIDDANSLITYSGTWGTGTGSANYNSTEHYSGTTNSYAEFTFTGSSIKWYGVKNQWCGIADVYIDNVKQTSVDTYSATQLDQQTIYSNTGLTNASHKIKIVVTGTRNASSGGINVSIDALEYSSSGTTNTVYNRVRKIGTNFWFLYGQTGQDGVDWTGVNPWYSKDINFTDTNMNNPWNPAFLDQIKIYQVLRFMDWLSTNQSPNKNWTDRTQKRDKYQVGTCFSGTTDAATVTQQDGRQTTGVAYEWLIDLCNRNSSDMWINIPHQVIDPADFPNGIDFNNEYVQKLAILIKYGVDMKNVSLKAKVGGSANLYQLANKTKADFISWGGVETVPALDPSLKVYVEYSNEIWMRTQNTYCNQKANAIGFSGDWQFPYYGAYAEIRCFKAFQDVFGSDMSNRVVKVAGFEYNWKQVVADGFSQVYDNTASNRNPWNIQPDVWKWASYIGGAYSDNWYTAVDTNVKTSTQELRDYIKSRGLKYVNYEGGQHLDDNAGTFARDSATYNKYMYWLQQCYANDSVLTIHYTHAGKFQTDASGYGSWGALDYDGQDPANAPKYRALKDFVDGK